VIQKRLATRIEYRIRVIKGEVNLVFVVCITISPNYFLLSKKTACGIKNDNKGGETGHSSFIQFPLATGGVSARKLVEAA